MPNTRIWDKHEIKAEIHRRGMTLNVLSEMYGLSSSAVRVTLLRRKAITKADQAISDFLKVPLHELWPERYDEKGRKIEVLKPIKRVRELKPVKRGARKPAPRAAAAE